MNDSVFEQGLRVRRQVLGDAYVDAALDRRTPFNTDLQTLITEYCWGTVWTRDGLPLATRSLLNIAMMVALNRPHELKTHVGGALRNGCTEEEIAEALLQATVYAGIPAGVDAFRSAEEAIEEHRSGETG